MGFHDGRFNSDPAAFNGQGFPSILDLNISGNLLAYTSGVSGLFVPPSFQAEHKGVALTIADIQFWYGTQGVGATSLADNFFLQLIDSSVDAAGAGTVSTSGTAVTGSGTAFLTLFALNDYIRSGANTFKITAIADNTHLTLEAAPAVDWSAAAYFRVPNLGTLAAVSVARNLKFGAPQDLRTNGVGLIVKPGQGVRIDVGAIGLTYSTAPANIRVHLGIEAYSFVG